ncbi:MAG: hypothetical protein JW802_04980 [Campylobacterales bacterium]|nr:hypothetical protein [Campylobacterales bacterium]
MHDIREVVINVLKLSSFDYVLVSSEGAQTEEECNLIFTLLEENPNVIYIVFSCFDDFMKEKSHSRLCYYNENLISVAASNVDIFLTWNKTNRYFFDWLFQHKLLFYPEYPLSDKCSTKEAFDKLYYEKNYNLWKNLYHIQNVFTIHSSYDLYNECMKDYFDSEEVKDKFYHLSDKGVNRFKSIFQLAVNSLKFRFSLREHHYCHYALIKKQNKEKQNFINLIS